MPESNPTPRQLINDIAKARYVLFLVAAGIVAFILLNRASADIPGVALAVGASIVAALIVHVLYERVAEETITQHIAAASTLAAVDTTREFLVRHFSQVVPRKTYPRSKTPLEEFRSDFGRELAASNIYHHKGSDASFAAFRLTSLANHPAVRDKREIVVGVLDPRLDWLVHQRAKSELEESGRQYSKRDLDEEMVKVRDGVFVTLEALFRVSHAIRVVVFFHRDTVFFRSEILDNALYVSYYLGGEYPGTYCFDGSTYMYKAFQKNFALSREAAETIYLPQNYETESAFHLFLTQLGCKHSLRVLGSMRDDRHKQLARSLRFSTAEPF